MRLCGMRGNGKDESFKKDHADCNFGRRKNHLGQVCRKKAKEPQAESLVSRLTSTKEFCSATDHDLLLD